MTARRQLPPRRLHEVFEFEHEGQRYTAGYGQFNDGSLAEVFLNSSKSGTALETNARDGAVLLSLLLQHGVPVDQIRKTLTCNVNGSPSGPLGRVLDLIAVESA